MLDQKFKVYFFDVDGTLADSKKVISDEIADLLSQLSQTNKVAIISGETRSQLLKQVISQLDNKTDLSNIILLPTSGASLYFYNKGDWREVYNNAIAESRVSDIEDKLYKAFRKNRIPVPRKSYGKKLEYRGAQITFSAFGQEAPYDIKSKWDPKFNKRRKIVADLKTEIKDLDIKIGGTNSIDFTLTGIDKAYGINRLAKYLDTRPDECVFIGDALFVGGNDYSVVKTGINTIVTSGPQESIDILKALVENRKYNKSLFLVIKEFFVKFLDYLKKIIEIFFSPFRLKPLYREDEDHIYVTRSSKNPILSPTAYSWENEGVFNPAAIYLGGRVHLLYRAIGSNGISTIGYASSEDGIHFDERLPHPIYYPDAEFELDRFGNKKDQKFNPDKYCSGGGWTGCEDPKVCHIGDRIFLTYVAFAGWDSVRVALSSITVDDFLNKKWRWTTPILCTPRGVVSKSGGLFPEKIKGKYIFFQRIFPNILLDYLDDLRFFEEKLPKGNHQIPPQEKGWDSRKVSFGSTPIKTKHGWLVITHGVDDAHDHQYHMGAMILDLENPEKVLYRSKKPILSPELWYENDWKPGVVYPCGAVNKDGTLLIYYGGGDKYVCVASAPMDQFLDSLMHGKKPKLKNDRLKFKK